MPMVNGIQLELQCQQNISTGGPIEEFAPRLVSDGDAPSMFMPELYNHKTRTCSVFIPIFPRAQFSLKYELAPLEQSSDGRAAHSGPQPISSTREHEFYVLQLLIGKDEITTWSCGAQQDWKGKTCFALFDHFGSGTDADGIKTLEKRIFAFNGDIRVVGDLNRDEDCNRKIEVKVYRANKSLRQPAVPSLYEGQGMTEDVRTPTSGVLATNQCKKYHMFGLVDHVGRPHAVFRWFYRSWDEIHALKLSLGGADEEAAIAFTKLGVSKHPSKKTVHVDVNAASMTGIGASSASHSQGANHPKAHNDGRKPPAPLRYDKSRGSFVPLRDASLSSDLQSLQRQVCEKMRLLQFPGKTSLHKADGVQHDKQLPSPCKQTAHGAGPSRSKNGSVHIPASMLLPPQHPHARPLPKVIDLKKTRRDTAVAEFRTRAAENVNSTS